MLPGMMSFFSPLQTNEIREDWKPSFLSNEEFTHLMLEAIEGFLLVFSAADGSIVYASESVTSLLGHLPDDLAGRSMYEMVAEADKPRLYSTLQQGVATAAGTNVATADEEESETFFGPPVELQVHMRRGGLPGDSPPSPLDIHEDEGSEERAIYELMCLSGYFRKWRMDHGRPASAGDSLFTGDPGGGGGAASDDDNASVKSGLSRLSSAHDAISSGAGPGESGAQERTVLVCTARLKATQLLRETPLAVGGSLSLMTPPASPASSSRRRPSSNGPSSSSRRRKSASPMSRTEFTSRYSLEWKFLYLDHRAPQVQKNVYDTSSPHAND
jgi:hypothetical protein